MLPASPFLYPVIDSQFSKDIVADCERVLDAGAQIFQIRAKDFTQSNLYKIIEAVLPMANRFHSTLVVNDEISVALVFEGAGVHIGQEDFPVNRARTLLPDRILGFSTHNVKQFEEAAAMEPDYISIGPIFPTGSKINPDPPLGLEILEKVRSLSPKPVVAIGGIKEHHFADLVAAEVDGIALISELYTGNDVGSVCRRLMTRLDQLR